MHDVNIASDTLAEQSSHGMQALAPRVLPWGPTPELRDVRLFGDAENIDVTAIPSHLLYARLCDLEALRVAVSGAMANLAEALITRGYLVEVPADEDICED